MIHAIRKSFWVLTAGWLVVTGCGDDDDNDANTGGSGGNKGGAAGSSGSQNRGGGGASAGTGGNRGGNTGTGGSKAGAGAGGDGGAGGQPSSVQCEVLGELCHDADAGSGLASECHDVGHSNDPVECKARFAECIAVCVGGETGGGGAGGGGGAPSVAGGGAGGGGSTPAPHCAALGELCHPVSGQSAALAACHDLGHVGDEAACEAEFVPCAVACLAAREGSGAGGAGGMSGGGAGGVSSGGGGAGGAGGG